MTLRIAAETPWYELFSRGARDWLRHNQKVREAVKSSLPDLLAGEDLMTNAANRTVAVPVRLLEHARLRLVDADSQQGAGQGRGEPGDGAARRAQIFLASAATKSPRGRADSTSAITR
jgi:uncharacterized sporulation protein YeaH/YhbH (DUF444 family)